MLDIAMALKQSGGYCPMFLFEGVGYGAAEQKCRELGIQYRAEAKSSSRGETLQKRQPASPLFLRRFFIRLKKSFWPQFVLAFIQYGRTIRRANRLLDEMDPQAILLIGDRHIGIETALVKRANRRGIPSLMIPFALSDVEGAVLYRLANPDWRLRYGVESWLNRILARLRPAWVTAHEGQKLFWQPPAAMLAAALWGILPQKPWVLGGGAAWMMAVENPQSQDRLVRQGMPPEKITVTGKPRYDRAAKVWRRRAQERQQLFAAIKLDANKPLLTCAVPQLGEHELLPWERHWEETEFLFATLSRVRSDVNVVLSLHPKSDLQQYAPRAEQYGLTIARTHRYDQLIPVSDLFVATFSSTVTLAIAAHIPTLVIDFYAMNYDFFDEVEGIVVLREKKNLLPTLRRALTDRAYYQQLVDGQARAADDWARFDGQATARILKLIDELVARGDEIGALPRRLRRNMLPPWSQ